MCSKYNKNIDKIREVIQKADAIVIGAGAGLSTSAGFTYSGKRFEDNFQEFIDKYGMEDMYSAGFYPFETEEEKWAYWSKHIYHNRYDVNAGKPYVDLYNIVKNKNYFVLTTNVDHQFQMAGFDEERIFATQGDYGLLQCAKGCHNKLYYNEEIIREMIDKQKECSIPTELVPKCPVCGGSMEVNLRCDEYFVEDEAWHKSSLNYENFIKENANKSILFIELGVGMNTPVIIKYSFWRMVYNFKDAFYVCINLNEAWAPEEIREKAICIDGDIKDVLMDIKECNYESR